MVTDPPNVRLGRPTSWRGGSVAGHVATGDFNGDGHADIVTAEGVFDPETAEFSYFFGLYFGPFQIPGDPPAPDARIVIPQPLGVPFTPNVGDIDADGFDDIAFGHLDVAYIVYGKGR